MSTFSREELKKKLKNADFNLVVKDGEHVCYSNAFWPKLFSSEDLDYCSSRQSFDPKPEVTFVLEARKTIRIDGVEFSIKEAENVWHYTLHEYLKKGPLFLNKRDRIELTFDLAGIWNGK